MDAGEEGQTDPWSVLEVKSTRSSVGIMCFTLMLDSSHRLIRDSVCQNEDSRPNFENFRFSNQWEEHFPTLLPVSHLFSLMPK